ncbi:TIGR00645 family protein [Acidocella facilis]|uniref:TIGR00645 family protein n=1 Tax=Acidocella facilis TaxID=525 RepID=UPI000479D83D|nr:TIGR00645 family protein [Acidocella facilis]
MSPTRIIEAILFGGRWLIVPVYLAMLVLLGIIVVYFIGELVHALPTIASITENQLLIFSLSLIDLSLTANLVVLVILSGYENFVRKVAFDESDPRPEWMSKIDFSGLKLKLLASMTVIGAVHLLRSFLDVANETDRNLFWQLVIVLAFGLLSLVLALTDRVEHKE